MLSSLVIARSEATKQSQDAAAEIATACFAGLAMTKAVRGESAEDSRLCRMGVNDIRLEPPKVLFDLAITYEIVNRTNRAYEFTNDNCSIFLVFGLLK